MRMRWARKDSERKLEFEGPQKNTMRVTQLAGFERVTNV